MLQSEFDRLTSRPYTEAEFSEIHYVYCYHPAVRSKKDIADLWTIGGICLIKDMWPTARRVEEAEHKRSAARTAYEHVKVIEDVQDKHGNYCIIFKSTNLRLIYDWLHTHYSGNG